MKVELMPGIASISGTIEEQNGWRRVFLPDQQKTIYVK